MSSRSRGARAGLRGTGRRGPAALPPSLPQGASSRGRGAGGRPEPISTQRAAGAGGPGRGDRSRSRASDQEATVLGHPPRALPAGFSAQSAGRRQVPTGGKGRPRGDPQFAGGALPALSRASRPPAAVAALSFQASTGAGRGPGLRAHWLQPQDGCSRVCQKLGARGGGAVRRPQPPTDAGHLTGLRRPGRGSPPHFAFEGRTAGRAGVGGGKPGGLHGDRAWLDAAGGRDGR